MIQLEDTHWSYTVDASLRVAESLILRPQSNRMCARIWMALLHCLGNSHRYRNHCSLLDRTVSLAGRCTLTGQIGWADKIIVAEHSDPVPKWRRSNATIAISSISSKTDQLMHLPWIVESMVREQCEVKGVLERTFSDMPSEMSVVAEHLADQLIEPHCHSTLLEKTYGGSNRRPVLGSCIPCSAAIASRVVNGQRIWILDDEIKSDLIVLSRAAARMLNV
jgi:hypothetical protein